MEEKVYRLDDIHNMIKMIINNVKPIQSYAKEDSIFSAKYGLSTSDITYILFNIAEEFRFSIHDDFIDALRDSRFENIACLINQYQGMGDTIY